MIGAHKYPAERNHGWRGDMDEVYVCGRALSARDIADDYNLTR